MDMTKNGRQLLPGERSLAPSSQEADRMDELACMPHAARLRALLAQSWAVSWPMILIMLLEFIIGVTDVAIAGRLGKEIQAAVGLVSQVYFLFVVAANALTVGTVAVVARLIGAETAEPLSEAVMTLILASLLIGALLGAAGMALAPAAIRVMGVPAELTPYAATLIRWYAAGLVGHYLLINSNGILRATRRATRSLATMSAVCLVNVTLNLLLVFGTPLGFRGIALSTVMALALGCVLNLIALRPLLSGGLRLSRRILKRVLAIGWPAALLQTAWQAGSTTLFLIVGRLPTGGVEVMAALTNGLRVESVIFLPAYAMNMANAVVVGNLLGENRGRDAFRGGIVTAAVGVGVILVLTVLVILGAPLLAGLLSASQPVVRETVRYLYISMLSEPFMAWAVILGGGLNGAGDTRAVMTIVVLSLWLVRIPASYLGAVVLGWGPAAIWWSMNASILVHSLFLTRRYMSRRWLPAAPRRGRRSGDEEAQGD
jgi:putative MATE family efflux protein